MEAIVATELTKKYGKLFAVDNLSLSVAEGEVVGLLGPNGAGKTTTIRLLASLIRPTSGKALVCGHDISRNPERVRESVSLVTDKIILYERLTALENLVFFAQLGGLSLKEAISKSNELLEDVEMTRWKNKQVRFLSSGMKQRINVIRGLLNQPRLLFLDEPTIGLDPRSTSKMRELIARLKNDGQTVILTTHLTHDAETLCDRIVLMHAGQIVASGTLEELRILVNPSEVVGAKTSLEEIYMSLMPE